MRSLRSLWAWLALIVFVLVPREARADGEVWIWTENRIPIVRTDTPGFPRLDWRLITDFRFNQRAGGLHQAFFRTGPAFYATDWLFMAVNGVVYADRQPDGRFLQEGRLELEPNLFGRFGDFTFNDRNRFESRWREGNNRWRYRNQLRINYAPKGAKWIPFVWDEILVDLSGTGFHQNRFDVGIARMLTETIRLDVAYMLRSREDQGKWTNDHIFNLYFYFDVPPKAAPPPPALPMQQPPPAPMLPPAPGNE
ncbi:DUF2490 domain-containing protein [Labilithrix luteola]|uniref:DUF2490 domain-containing protein n=1 Tax=Labilithrix luteola TaxID=1391654 RepID=UPI0014733AF9|nr:DUF2490 domain-containing protein [Labilithrix luteola]